MMKIDFSGYDMNELRFGERVRQTLNQGMPLNAEISERLRAAREQALQRQLLARPETAPAWADNVLGRFGGLGGFSLRVLVPFAMLVIGLLAIQAWQEKLIVAEVEEIDAQLLTDDLPIDALLDKGFETWLKKRSSL
jgi:hypothetical protein